MNCKHEWLPLEQVCLHCGLPRTKDPVTLGSNRPKLPPRPNLDPPSTARKKVYFNRTGRR